MIANTLFIAHPFSQTQNKSLATLLHASQGANVPQECTTNDAPSQKARPIRHRDSPRENPMAAFMLDALS
jgi:hypothetical protein